jgi:hypothetical protein
MAVMRLRLPWLIAVPLAVIGTLAGHSVGYWAAVPDAHERSHVLASSGHGYLEYAPLAIALCIAIAALGFVAIVLAAVRREPARVGSPRFGLVAALPPVAFALQELIERYAHAGHVHWELVLSAPFLLGLATQLPFSLLAAAIAFALATAAERVGRVLGSAGRSRPRALPISFLTWFSVDLPRRPILARGYTGRGPPLLA